MVLIGRCIQNSEGKKMIDSGEAERHLISAVLNTRDDVKKQQAIDTVSTEMFSSERNKSVWEVVKSLSNEGHLVDVSAMFGRLPDEIVYISDIAQEKVFDTQVSSYVDRVKKCAYLREAYKRTTEALRVITELTDLTAINSVPTAIEGVFEGLMLDTMENKPKLFKDVAKDFVQRLDDKLNGKEDLHVIKSGIPELDYHTGGFNLTDLITIAGLSGSGKTEYALKIINAIASQGYGTLIFSLEMSNLQVVERLVGQESQLPTGDLRTPSKLNEDGFQRISTAIGGLNERNVYMYDQSGLTINQVVTMSRAHKARHPDCKAIVLDHVGLMNLDGTNGSHHLQVGEISKRLKNLAKELQTPVVLLSQVVGKLIMQRPVKDRIPNAQDVKDTSRVEEDSDLILFTHRQNTHDENAPPFAELVLGKARHAIKGTKVYSNFVNGHFSPTDQAYAHNQMDSYYNAQVEKKGKNF